MMRARGATIMSHSMPNKVRAVAREAAWTVNEVFHEYPVEVTLGGVAVAAWAYYFLSKSKRSPQAPASRISVQGVWTDLATKLNIAIGSGLDTQTAQRYLNTIAKAGLKEDGILGPATQKALRNFQAGNGLPQTGVVDEETGNALQYMAAATSKNPQLQKMATVPTGTFGPWYQRVSQVPKLGAPFSDNVKMSAKGAQRALNDLMHVGLPMTGVLDFPTVTQVRIFQAWQGMPATGQLDSETANALLYLASSSNPAYAAVTYALSPMPQAIPQPQAVTYRSSPMPRPPYAGPPPLSASMQARLAQASTSQPVDIGGGWLMFGNCACQKNDVACIASCGGAPQMTAGEWDDWSDEWGDPHAVGVQSTTVYDSQFHYSF